MLTSPASIEIVKSQSLTTLHSQYKGVTMKKTVQSIFMICFVLSTLAMGQDDGLQGTLNKLAGKAALGFIDPITQGLLTNVNGGLFNKAPQAKLWGIDIEVGAALMYTPLGDLPKTFSEQGTFTFNQDQATTISNSLVTGSTTYDNEVRNALKNALQQSSPTITISGPTVIGEKYDAANPNSPQVKIDINTPVNITLFQGTPFQRDTSYTVNYILKTGLGGVGALSGNAGVPFVAPQLTLGTLFGTKFTLRYLPKIKIQDLGDLSWTGFGIQHNLGYWFPIPVVDVAASFYTQKIKIDPIFEMTGTSFGLTASKQLGFAFLNVTPYAGFMLESSKMKVNITPPAADYGPGITPPSIGFEVEGKNKSRFVIGLGLRILIININADYNIGKYNSMTAGVALAF